MNPGLWILLAVTGWLLALCGFAFALWCILTARPNPPDTDDAWGADW